MGGMDKRVRMGSRIWRGIRGVGRRWMRGRERGWSGFNRDERG